MQKSICQKIGCGYIILIQNKCTLPCRHNLMYM
uniref:Uncharacterized protein n=1 Tax=Arundo donax TaxID=35708 RepID=A0A0A9FHN8_ARUDO